MAVPPDSSLCSGCGLCCLGWIFFQTSLSQAEADSLAAYTSVTSTAIGPVIRQPCALNTNTLCGVYELRPAACRDYSCASLSAVERGDLAFDQARARLDRARSGLADLGHALRAAGWMTATDTGVEAWRKFTAAARQATDPVTFRRDNAQVLLAGATAAAAGALALGDCL